jgi:molybdate transport system substrate-binding protein
MHRMPMLARRLAGALAGVALVAAVGCGGDASGGGSGAAGSGDSSRTITVFAAASLTDAVGDAADAFEAANPGVTVELNLGGSSSLREQVLAGAPADVFASADRANVDQLAEAGEIDGDGRVLARNSLEIAVPAGNPGGVTGLADLADPDLLVGLCAPEVPCGGLGRRALDQAGVTAAPDTEEPDVRSLLTKVAAGDLDAGLVYRTDVVAAGEDVEGIALPPEVDVEAEYVVARLARGGEPDTADAFIDLLLADEGRAILASHGFAPA